MHIVKTTLLITRPDSSKSVKACLKQSVDNDRSVYNDKLFRIDWVFIENNVKQIFL